jgi:hypothetical protein
LVDRHNRNAQSIGHIGKRFKDFPRFHVVVTIGAADVGGNRVHHDNADVPDLAGFFLKQLDVGS